MRSGEHGKAQADSFKQQSSPNCMEGTSNADSQAKEHPSKTHIQNNLCVVEMKGNTATVLDFTPTTKDFESGVSKVNFQGVDVNSDVLPTLNKIWAKYGNIVEGCTVHNKDIVAWALESLAKVVILLQSNTGKSLNDYQVDYLNVILCDLKMMRLKVSWLVPFVERASTIPKGTVSQFQDSLEEIEKVKSQMEEMRTKFLVELGGLEQRLNDLRKIVSERLSVSGLVDQDKCLGEGLLWCYWPFG